MMTALAQGKQVMVAKLGKPILPIANDGIWLPLCGGMGCLGLIAKSISVRPTRYIGVEINPTARGVADNVHPDGGMFTVDHGWHNDINHISEQDVLGLGRNAISMVGFGSPCEDFSLLRLLPPRHKGDKLLQSRGESRPGLKGKKGRLLKECIRVAKLVLKYNPNCKYFGENIDFSDMADDWNEVCADLGTPLIVDSANFSNTRRTRAYWTNLEGLEGMFEVATPLDGDECMDPGRTLIRQQSGGQRYVRTIGKSWKGDPTNPVADTRLPVLVKDINEQKLQHLRPHEAEQLMGMPRDCTAGNGATAKERLMAVGNGWDLNVVGKFFDNYRDQVDNLSAVACTLQQVAPVPTNLSQQDRALQCSLAIMTQQMPADDFKAMLAQYSLEQQLHMFGLLRGWYQMHPSCQVSAPSGSILDSGSSRHLDPRVTVTNSEDTVTITGFDNSQHWTTGNG
jgi:hypothetical protein